MQFDERCQRFTNILCVLDASNVDILFNGEVQTHLSGSMLYLAVFIDTVIVARGGFK